MIPLTADQVQRATGSTLANAELYLPFLQGACKAYDITSPKRLAGFLSQIGHESQGMATLEESLNYSPERLMAVFGPGRIGEADAHQYGRRKGQPANQEMIANIVYGGVWGRKRLGNEHAGDGWRFRGRGLKQLTGRFNYMQCGDAIGEMLTVYPERLLVPVNAALSAGWFWSSRGCNDLADAGDVVAMTRRINGGENGIEERTALWNVGLQVFA